MSRKLARRDFLRLSAAAATGAALAACQPATPQVVEVVKEVPVEKEVVKEVVKEVPVEKEVVKEVPVEKVVEKVVTPTAGPAPERVTVKYWGHAFEERVALDKVYIEQFMEEYPHITVEYDTPGDFNQMLPTALAAGTAGDLFGHSNRFTSQYYLQDAIVPVDYTAFDMDEATFMDTYVEPQNTLQGAIFEGELYGIPNEVSIYALHINNTLFQDAGLDPESDHPTTWAEFREIAEMLTKRDASGKLVQRGAILGWKSGAIASNIFGGQLRQAGGGEVSDDYRTAVIDSEAGERTLEYWKEFVDANLDGPQYPQDQSQCLLGDLAMWGNTGSWRRPGLLDAGIEYSVWPAPRWADAVRDMGFYTYAYFHMVNARSPDAVKRAAWQLAWYLDSHPARYLDLTGLLQPKKEVLSSEAYLNTPYLNVFLEEMSTGTYAPGPPGWMEIIDSMDRMRDRVAEGTEAKDSLGTTNQEIQEILDEEWAALG